MSIDRKRSNWSAVPKAGFSKWRPLIVAFLIEADRRVVESFFAFLDLVSFKILSGGSGKRIVRNSNAMLKRPEKQTFCSDTTNPTIHFCRTCFVKSKGRFRACNTHGHPLLQVILKLVQTGNGQLSLTYNCVLTSDTLAKAK